MDPNSLWQSWGFVSNPFNIYTATREENLPRIFLEPPYFKEIVGDPLRPQSNIVFGYRGEGKSMLFEMLAYCLETQESAKVLIVKYEKFSRYLTFNLDDSTSISLEDHLRHIIGLCVERFVEECEKDIKILRKLSADELSIVKWYVLRFLPASEYRQVEQRLLSLIYEISTSGRRKKHLSKGYHKLVSLLRRKKIDLYNLHENSSWIHSVIKVLFTICGPSIPMDKDLRRESALRLLERFRDIICVAGFDSVYVLIDKIDENDALSGNYKLMVNLFAPLITSLDYLETERFATKIFLPMPIKDLLGNRLRTDRITPRIISWSDKSLLAMLTKRLAGYSNDNIDLLEPFISEEIRENFTEELLFYSASCPRNLIRIIGHIMSELCQIENVPTTINKEAVVRGLKHFLSMRMGEEDATEYMSRLSTRRKTDGQIERVLWTD